MKKIIRDTALSLLVAILVLGVFSAVSAPHVKAQDAASVNVTSFNWYLAPAYNLLGTSPGDLVVVGEVQNIGTTPLTHITLFAEAYNSSHAMIQPNNGLVLVDDPVLPGQKAPFYIDFSQMNEDPSDIWDPSSVTNVTVGVIDATPSNETVYSGLTANSLIGTDVGGTYTLRGTISNTGTRTVGGVYAEITFYNSSGKVVAFNSTNPLDSSPGYLSPGNSVTFTATPVDNTATLSSQIENYSVLVEYQPYSSPAATPTPPGTTPTPSISTSTGATSTPTNKAGSQVSPTIMYAAITAVVLVVVALVALMLFRKPKGGDQSETLPPPPPPPPPPQ